MFNWFKRKKKTRPLASVVVQPAAIPAGDDIATSIAWGYMLNDAIAEGIIGGNLAGGMIGEAMNTSEHTSSVGHGCHDSPSVDCGGSYDSGSSCDADGF